MVRYGDREVIEKLEAECDALRAGLTALCDRVGDFQTAYTGEEGWRIIPDMLANMEDGLVAARRLLAELS